jgi:ornithine cyclodeaminase
MQSGQGFDVVGGPAVRAILAEHREAILALVRDAYTQHDSGQTINPDSYFLRFPDKPSARIIALPARVHDQSDVAGIKWISSFPENRQIGLARASAVIVLNRMETGFPYACLEGSYISAARTAASATLAAELLHHGKQAEQVAVIGTGPIAANIVDFLLATGWKVGRFLVNDLISERANIFCDNLRDRGYLADPEIEVENAIATADLVLFATTAAKPYLTDPKLFDRHQTVLHVSLRDLGVDIIRSAQNVVDDIEHCLKAQTSVHLTEQATGSRAFIDGTIADLVTGRLRPDPQRARIFSPFGLGVLDIAVAHFVHQSASASGRATAIDGFFAGA